MSTQTQVKAVIFDVAGVVVDWKASRAFEGTVDPEAATSFLESEAFPRINALTDAGMTLEQAAAEFDRTAPEHAATFRSYVENFPRTVVGPIPGTEQLVEDLLAAGHPVFGLSNWAAENFHVARSHGPAIGRFQDIIVSGEVGLAKPDEAIFRLALERFGLEAGSTLMIDDMQPNLDAAARVGLQTLHFRDAAQARSELRILNLL